MSRLLTICFLLLVALSSQAKVMVYDGFYFDPDDSLAYKSRNVGGSPTRYIVGMTGAECFASARQGCRFSFGKSHKR